MSLSNENYSVALNILKDRFGNVQDTVDLHYTAIINMKSASDSVDSLRCLLDGVDKHLRSLDVLGQNINQDLFVSIIKSKLPSSVIRHLEIKKGIESKWTVLLLKELLKEYVVACEKAKTDSDKAFGQKPRFGVRPEHTYRSDRLYSFWDGYKQIFHPSQIEKSNSMVYKIRRENQTYV